MGINIVITAGGTSERIDRVRKITNSSSGKLGYTIANKLIEKINDKIDTIYYISSKEAIKPVGEKIKLIEVFDCKELKVAVEELLTSKHIDYFIHAMAVSDYTVDFVTTAKKIAENIIKRDYENIINAICSDENSIKANKISSNEEDLIIKLKKNPKIISLIKNLSPKTYLIGFKLLDGVSEKELIDVATDLKDKNKCDLVVANDLENIRHGNHIAYIIRGENDYTQATGKEEIAEKLIVEILND